MWIINGTGLTGGNISTSGTIGLANTAVTAGTYGNSTAVASCTYDSTGRATTCSNISISFPSSSGTVTWISFNTSGLLGGNISTSGTIALNETYINLKWNDTAYATSLGNWSADKSGIQTNITNVNTTANTKAIPGSSALCTYGIANFTTSNSIAPSVTCAAAQGSGAGNLSAQGATAGYIPQFQNMSVLNNSIISQSGSLIGIGDATPDALLDVQSSSVANQLRVSYDDSNYGNISVNSGGNMTIKATGHVIIDIS
jgi:hypothetical protein